MDADIGLATIKIPSTLAIGCLVVGELSPFAVIVDSNILVSQFKKAIYQERPSLPVADYTFLSLYKVDLPDDDDLTEVVEQLTLEPKMALKATKRLSSVFLEPLELERVYILIQPLALGKWNTPMDHQISFIVHS
jgi:hypothetical protein